MPRGNKEIWASLLGVHEKIEIGAPGVLLGRFGALVAHSKYNWYQLIPIYNIQYLICTLCTYI